MQSTFKTLTGFFFALNHSKNLKMDAPIFITQALCSASITQEEKKGKQEEKESDKR
jgi:hypothetical protein